MEVKGWCGPTSGAERRDATTEEEEHDDSGGRRQQRPHRLPVFHWADAANTVWSPGEAAGGGVPPALPTRFSHPGIKSHLQTWKQIYSGF